MPTTPTTDKPAVKVDSADHDRVVMLSLKVDGTPDQTNPEIIGDPDIALEAAKEQFAQKAVAAVDQRMRGTSSEDGPVDLPELQKAHDDAEKAAHKQAEATIKALS